MRQERRGITAMKIVFPISLFIKKKGKGIFFPLRLKPPQNSPNHRGKRMLTKTPLKDAIIALTPPERGGGTTLTALQVELCSQFNQGLGWAPYPQTCLPDPNAWLPRNHAQRN